MSDLWLLTDAEDERLQGLTAEAQTIYMRIFRRYMNFETGVVAVTLGTMKRCIEYIPDKGSHIRARRVADIDNNYIRARVAELERAGLVEKGDKSSRFEAPTYRCLCARLGSIRLEDEPQANHKERGTSRTTSAPQAMARGSDRGTTTGTTTEPQEANHKIPGIGEEVKTKDIDSAPAQFAEFWAAYPNKTGRKPCLEKWKAKRLDAMADRIIADVQERASRDRRWLDGFVPNPLTYLNQERWTDEIQERPAKAVAPTGNQRRSGFRDIDYEREAQEMGFRTEVD